MCNCVLDVSKHYGVIETNNSFWNIFLYLFLFTGNSSSGGINFSFNLKCFLYIYEHLLQVKMKS